jgi:hypothetical protein
MTMPKKKGMMARYLMIGAKNNGKDPNIEVIPMANLRLGSLRILFPACKAYGQDSTAFAKFYRYPAAG